MKKSKNRLSIRTRFSGIRYYAGLLLVFMLFVFTSFYSRDPDFGWHLRSGEHFLTYGVPKTDIFTFTAASFHWINHEWLNDIIVYLVNHFGTKLSLAIFFSALWCLALILASRKKSVFVLLLASIAILPFSGIRPILWSVLFVAIIERIHDSKNKKILYFIPLIFLFWANLHGGFIFGILLITIWQFNKKTRINWLIYFTSLVVVFINPYFWRIFIEIGSTLLDNKIKFRIAEWFPLKLPWSSVLYVSAYLIAHFSIKKHPFKKLFSIPGLTLFMALSSIRHLPLFVITSVRYFENSLSELVNKIEGTNISRGVKSLGYISLIIFVSFAGFITAKSAGATRYSEYYYPAKAVEYIKQHPCNQNIYNDYNYGGYLIEKLPNNKVYIDGRMPSWIANGVSYFENYAKFSNDEGFRNSEISKYNINCLIIEKNNKLGEKIVSSGWILISEASTKNYSLYFRGGN